MRLILFRQRRPERSARVAAAAAAAAAAPPPAPAAGVTSPEEWQTLSQLIATLKQEGKRVRVAAIGAPRATPDYEALQVMNESLGGLFSSRINLNLREAHDYSYGAGSQFVFRRAPGPFLVATGVRTEVTGPAIGEIFKEIRGMREKPPVGDELALAKDSIVRSLPAQFETSRSVTASTANIYIYDLEVHALFKQHDAAALAEWACRP